MKLYQGLQHKIGYPESDKKVENKLELNVIRRNFSEQDIVIVGIKTCNGRS